MYIIGVLIRKCYWSRLTYLWYYSSAHEQDAKKIQHSSFKENLAKNCPIFYSQFRIFTSRVSPHPKKSEFNGSYGLHLEIKSEVLTKRCYWKVFGTWQHTTCVQPLQNDLISLWSLCNITPQATCEEKEDIRSFKWYRRYGWGWGLPKPPSKSYIFSSDISKSPEYTISLIFFEKT